MVGVATFLLHDLIDNATSRPWGMFLPKPYWVNFYWFCTCVDPLAHQCANGTWLQQWLVVKRREIDYVLTSCSIYCQPDRVQGLTFMDYSLVYTWTSWWILLAQPPSKKSTFKQNENDYLLIISKIISTQKKS